MDVKIRPARPEDQAGIISVLKELDLYYAGLKLKDFWVTEQAGRIVGTVQLEDQGNFLFLGSLGVASQQQKQGLGARLMQTALNQSKKDIYLYTIIPEFFKHFGFEITAANPGLPTKERYECADCHAESCVTMVHHAA